jgi:chlorophyllide a reductase subunit Y
MKDGPVAYDDADSVEVEVGTEVEGRDAPIPQDGLGCHSGNDMAEAAKLAGNSTYCYLVERLPYFCP